MIMRTLIYMKASLRNRAGAIIKKISTLGIRVKVLFPGKIDGKETLKDDYDLFLIIGDDKTVLRAFHELSLFEVPFLGINYTNNIGFLTEISFNDLDWAMDRLLSDDYTVEECNTLTSLIDYEIEAFAINDICIFPSKSATIMKYDLWVDGEYIWCDMADGIIIATPIGSTAYSMSAGGPMLLTKVRALVVTPVNSIDLTRRSLIIPSESKVEINELECSRDIEAIADGIERYKVRETIILSGNGRKLKLIRLKRSSHAYDRLYKKVELAKALIEMPPSAKLVLKVLEYEGPMTQKDIVQRTLLPPRTVRYALSLLLRKGLVMKTPNLRDARQSMYYARI